VPRKVTGAGHDGVCHEGRQGACVRAPPSTVLLSLCKVRTLPVLAHWPNCNPSKLGGQEEKKQNIMRAAHLPCAGTPSHQTPCTPTRLCKHPCRSAHSPSLVHPLQPRAQALLPLLSLSFIGASSAALCPSTLASLLTLLHSCHPLQPFARALLPLFSLSFIRASSAAACRFP